MRSQYFFVNPGVTKQVLVFVLVQTGVVVTPDSPSYQAYERAVPVAITLSVALYEEPASVAFCGCCEMAGAAQTVTVAVALLATTFEHPAWAGLVTCTQYDVVVVNAGVVKSFDTCPVTGLDVTPLVPVYH